MWLSEEGISIATSRTMRKLGIAEERNVTPINIDWNISNGEDGGEFTAWARDGAINLIAGKTYSVTTDSGSFTAVCKNQDGILYLGNLSFMIPGIPNDGESFAVMETADAGGVASGAYDFNKGKTLTIAEVTQTTTPIDPKYLPGVCLPFVELNTVVSPEGTELTAEESAAITAASERNLPIFVLHGFDESEKIMGLFFLAFQDGSKAYYMEFAGTIRAIMKTGENTWTMGTL